MYAALWATNEAIMRAKTRAELYELVCEAAAKGGRFNSASILLPRPDSDRLDIVASAGPTASNARRLQVSTSEAYPEGRGVCGTAFRTRQASLSNDFANDPRGAAFKQVIQSDGARSGAAFPLLVDEQCVGVMLFISSELDTFTPEFAELLQRLADNVSFALGNFDRADEKARTEEQKERLARMLAALSATNEAIVRAKSRAELFELVCEAAAQGGKFTSTKHRTGASRTATILDIVAAAGPTAASARRADGLRSARPIRKDAASGRNGVPLHGKPCIINDYLARSARRSAFHARARPGRRAIGRRVPAARRRPAPSASCCSSPPRRIRSRRNSSNCCSGWPTTSPLRSENFDRADEKARTEEQKERLARMLAALSATNEAIVRAKSPRRAVPAGVRGRGRGRQVHLDQSSALVRPDSDFFELVAVAGPTADSARRRQDFDQRSLSRRPRPCRAGVPLRQGLHRNDYLAEQRHSQAFHARARARTARSPARSFPLLVGGKVVGVMLFISAEKDTFTPEFVELLQRLDRQCLVRAGEFRPRRREEPGGRADRISRLA